MLGIYFSGTGNSKYCVERFIHHYGKGECISIEDSIILKKLSEETQIVIGYPIYYSNIPQIVRDFINTNASLFNNKKVFIIATMRIFSGDGTGCAARFLKQKGASILGGIHIIMPNNIGDVSILNDDSNKILSLLKKADTKIYNTVTKIKHDILVSQGLNSLSRFLGFTIQRAWFYQKSLKYHSYPNIDTLKCIGCSKCINICPMHNLSLLDKKAKANNKCTLCYRCLHTCPTQAITLLGNKVYRQYNINNYHVSG